MLNKQITILFSLALLAVFTLAETFDDLHALWAKDGSVNRYGVHIDLETECDGKPCNYPELVTYDDYFTGKVPPVSLVDIADCKNGLCSGLQDCEKGVTSGSGIFCMSDEEWEENFGDEEKDAAFMKRTGNWCATTQQYRREIREQKRRAKQFDQNNN